MNTDFFFSKICTWNKIYFECNYFKENLTKEKYFSTKFSKQTSNLVLVVIFNHNIDIKTQTSTDIKF